MKDDLVSPRRAFVANSSYLREWFALPGFPSIFKHAREVRRHIDRLHTRTAGRVEIPLWFVDPAHAGYVSDISSLYCRELRRISLLMSILYPSLRSSTDSQVFPHIQCRTDSLPFPIILSPADSCKTAESMPNRSTAVISPQYTSVRPWTPACDTVLLFVFFKAYDEWQYLRFSPADDKAAKIYHGRYTFSSTSRM